MTDRVAGHIFEGVGSDQRCACGRWWTDIWDCGDADLDQPNRSCGYGNLNITDLSEIRAKRLHEMRFWDAVSEVSNV